MNIFGEGFNQIVIDQIKQRQKRYGSLNRSNEELLYLNNKNGWCKLVSSVDIARRTDDTGKIVDYQGSVEDRMKMIEAPMEWSGANLAKAFMLYNGTSTQVTNNNIIQRSGLNYDRSIVNNNAYGLGGLEFGQVPMPGITSVEIKTLNRGSIKESTVQIKAFNRIQFQILDVLYLRLGYPILLEWGHTCYFGNDGTFKKDTDLNFSLANDFLNNTLGDTNEILKKIREQRLASEGNYDALLAKVKNFRWSFNKDGSYDITLSLISIGDVIESLMINAVLDKADITTEVKKDDEKEEAPSPDADPDEIIEYAAKQSEMGNIFYKAMKAVDGEPADSIANIVGEWEGKMSSYSWPQSEIDLYTGKKDIIKVEFDSWGPNDEFYYYRLGSLLKMIQNRCLIYDSKTGKPIINMDFDDNNFMYTSQYQATVDPRICIYYKNIFDRILFGACEKFEETINGVTVGKVMDIYVSMSYILTKIQENKNEDGRVPLITILEQICEGINSSTGYKNKLAPIIDEEENIVKIIDETPIPNKEALIDYVNNNASGSLNKEIAKFDIYGYYGGFGPSSSAGFIKDFSLSTEITPDLATMITVGATANGEVVGEDATAFSKWNVAVKNRIVENLVSAKDKDNISKSNSARQASAIVEERRQDAVLEEELKDLLDEYKEFVIDELSPADWDPEGWDANKDILKEILRKEQTIASRNALKNATNAQSMKEAGVSLRTGFIPFNMQLTMEGLSGMKVYQQFDIDSAFLPSNYPDTFKLLVKSVVHTIADNKWETKLETMSATTVTSAPPQNTSSDPVNSQDRILNNSSPTATRAAARAKIPIGACRDESSIRLSANFSLGQLSCGAPAASYFIPQVGEVKQHVRGTFDRQQIIGNLTAVANNILEPIFARFPSMIVTNAYRDKGGKSQHEIGEAVDIQFSDIGGSLDNQNRLIFERAKIIKNLLPSYDQFLLEYKTNRGGKPWIHISYRRDGRNRKEASTFLNDKYASNGRFNLINALA